MNVDKVCKFILNNLFLIAPNIKIACVNKDTTDHFHNCLKSVKIISLDIGICRIGREVLTCCAIGWAALCREWVVCRADKCLESSRASLSAADILRPAFLYNNITNQRQWSGQPVIALFLISELWLDVGILMWQSLETSQTKDRPRAILGRLQVSAPPLPSKYNISKSISLPLIFSIYQLWRVVYQWWLPATAREQNKSQQVPVIQWLRSWPQ